MALGYVDRVVAGVPVPPRVYAAHDAVFTDSAGLVAVRETGQRVRVLPPPEERSELLPLVPPAEVIVEDPAVQRVVSGPLGEVGEAGCHLIVDVRRRGLQAQVVKAPDAVRSTVLFGPICVNDVRHLRRPLLEQHIKSSGLEEYTSFEYELIGKGHDVTDDLITGPPGEGSAIRLERMRRDVRDPRVVFVVHGRDGKVRDAMFSFLRAIDLLPLEWAEAVSETGKSLPYVGDVLEAAFSSAQAVVVLMTPDDEACLRKPFRGSNDPPHETELTPQARPNVLFEAGMAMGRSPDRTIIVEVGTLRPFSDVGGRHVVRLDGTTRRRQELAQRLGTAGCPVRLTGSDWHTAGDFAPTTGE